MLYSILRPLLFRFDAETAHHFTLHGLQAAHRLCLSGLMRPAIESKPRQVMGLTFPNPVGLAAGLDKNGEYIDALAALGFGFIEIGTITPRPQPGNPQPRLFRLREAEAIINRMGFNNHGVDKLVENVCRARFRGILGINIGKNFDTPIERAADDYLICLRKVYPHASYVTVNISSPNTKNLRDLQSREKLDELLAAIMGRRDALAARSARVKPLAVKIAPDLDDEQIEAIAELAVKHRIDALIATNTTIGRAGVEGHRHAAEAGGLSGRPVFEISTAVLRKLSGLLKGRVPLIGVGGILTGADARAKIDAGASLVQVYTGFIYRGPDVIADARRALKG
jgi:dihydroorotate dehydrogenase